MRPVIVSTLAASAALLLTGCLGAEPDPRATVTVQSTIASTVHVTVTATPEPVEPEVANVTVLLGIQNPNALISGTICIATEEFSDFNDPALEAVVLDETGTELGRGTLGGYTIMDGNSGCVRSAAIEIPGDAQVVRAEIGAWASASEHASEALSGGLVVVAD